MRAPLALLSSALAGCLLPAPPYTLQLASAPSAPALEAIAGALSACGQPVEERDAAGVLATRWQDTGVIYGDLDGMTATLVRRYRVEWSASAPAEGAPATTGTAAADGGRLTLRSEAVRCVRGAWRVSAASSHRPSGLCDAVPGVMSGQRSEQQALGACLGQRLGAAPDQR